MKKIKKTVLALLLFSGAIASAQDSAYTNMIKIGVNGGVALPSENASANLGVDLGYQYLVTPGFGLGIATGYNQFFGKENDGIDNNDFAVVPVAAMFRYYPQTSGFYLGTDLGYGFITGDDKVASNSLVDRPTSGLYIKPEIGYHNIHWNFALQYTKVFTGNEGNIGSQDYSVGVLGVGIGYNLPLGK
ncbi:hypothetical protein FQU23_006615 [Flavobacterium sp. XN-5]|uniref:hypothetical protein n=1 Tax=Flavobacterium sp. XN-5 TaxID=2599390 RepID=UPI0011C775A0|nr:hypothetical protein [Flavobacterium sp. XN-5]NGY37185.1 hypothetical protein [Flavobacterium sp. XN-5]